MVIILMGVCGCGKTTVGKLLSDKLGLPFYDADHFHPTANVEKMRSGRPLDDNDRKPWLIELSGQIKKWNQTGGAVLACSALKESYRKLLQYGSKNDDINFVYLKGSKALIEERLENRSGHYMPAGLLDSQFKILEEPVDAIEISINQTVEKIVDSIINRLNEIS